MMSVQLSHMVFVGIAGVAVYEQNLFIAALLSMMSISFPCR